MGFLILFLLIAVPIAEIAVFIAVGERIGLWPTLGLVVLTALVGTALLRHQGLSTLMRAQESLAEDRFPVTEVFDGVCLLLAGALLLTPGFVTDGVGLLLFVPALRAALRRVLAQHLVASGRVHVRPERSPKGPTAHGATIIEGEFDEIADDDGPTADRSKPGPPTRRR